MEMRKQLIEILAVLKDILRLLKRRSNVKTDAMSGMLELDIGQLMTRMAVIDRLGISERTYNRWVKSGVLRPIEFGNRHLYREEDLQDAIRRSINKGLL
ncbi:hypothetical protein M472_11130 [Sphingobacterium paucimobilis HER1398]|uniref:Helix-turn-helix domain-containing protein n=2 Tax=Sphingobacterium TaxID=28453 RepID=U2HC44_9SPHI|nr:hypothetical protein M472_11130 [Sphingobacterium paucimobilis HER1398]